MMEMTATANAVGMGKVIRIIGVHFIGPMEDREVWVAEWAEEILQKSREAGIDVEADNYHLCYISLEACGGSLIIEASLLYQPGGVRRKLDNRGTGGYPA